MTSQQGLSQVQEREVALGEVGIYLPELLTRRGGDLSASWETKMVGRDGP